MTKAHTDAFGESYYDGNTGETYFKGISTPASRLFKKASAAIHSHRSPGL